jgi:hypothetical protein
MTGTLRAPERPSPTLVKSSDANKITHLPEPLVWSHEVIVYNLRCKNDHEFDGWFRDSAAFDAQSSNGLLSCPTCDSSQIEKSVMAPALASGRASQTRREEDHKMRQFMTGLRKYIQENAEYVGPGFAEEARRIHYGETANRHIYGETTLEEAGKLREDGIDVAPLPPDLDSAN